MQLSITPEQMDATNRLHFGLAPVLLAFRINIKQLRVVQHWNVTTISGVVTTMCCLFTSTVSL